MSIKSKKILVTGVAGFLGSHLSEKLVNLGHKVVGIDNMLGGYDDNIPKNVEFHEGDCCDFEKIKSIMKGVDVVYHCAATAHEGLSVFSPYEITKNNYLASVSIFSAAINEKVKRIIFCSSMARYGEIKPPFTEESIPNPVDPYGIAKVAAEETLKLLCEVHSMDYNIAVPHNIVGPNQKYDDPFRNVASIMINLMLQKRSPVIYGDGIWVAVGEDEHAWSSDGINWTCKDVGDDNKEYIFYQTEVGGNRSAVLSLGLTLPSEAQIKVKVDTATPANLSFTLMGIEVY